MKKAISIALIALFYLCLAALCNADEMQLGHTKPIPQNWQDEFFPGSQDLPNAVVMPYVEHSGMVKI
jgi:hypothetical protein